jgi:hypothetical protein
MVGNISFEIDPRPEMTDPTLVACNARNCR